MFLTIAIVPILVSTIAFLPKSRIPWPLPATYGNNHVLNGHGRSKSSRGKDTVILGILNDLNVRACEKKSHYLRGLGGRGQFLTISTSLYRRALYNDIEKTFKL